MRNSALSLALVGTLMLAVPASALAQDAQPVPTPQAQGQALDDAAVPAQAPAEAPGTTVDPDQAVPAQTETDEETTTDDEGVPQQYTDPLAGQDDDPGSGEQQSQETAPSTTAVQSVSAGTQLPSTGAPAGLLAIAGAALLVAGLAMRLLSRDSSYPYPYRRY